MALTPATSSCRWLCWSGDTNGDGFVNAGDAAQTRNRSGQTSDAINFRSDVNTDGFVNSGDTIVVRARSGEFLP